jgi:hypothetical protein
VVRRAVQRQSDLQELRGKGLGLAEAEAILLAQESGDVMVLLDDLPARQAAAYRGTTKQPTAARRFGTGTTRRTGTRTTGCGSCGARLSIDALRPGVHGFPEEPQERLRVPFGGPAPGAAPGTNTEAARGRPVGNERLPRAL